MRLLIISQYFPPEMGATQTRLFELAVRLKDMGHEMTVLTAMPNYPTGKIFEGYRGKIYMTEDIQGIKVVRVLLFPSKSQKSLIRLMSYLSFALSSLVFGAWRLGKQDIVLMDTPPPFTVPSGIIISKITKAKPVMIVADMWLQGLISLGLLSDNTLRAKVLLWLDKFCYRHSYAVALTNAGACQMIRERFPHQKNVALVSNGVDTNMFRADLRNEATRKKYGCGPDDFLFGYCGLHGLAQGLDIIVEAAKRLQDQRHIKFIMIGDGPMKQGLIQKAKAANLSNLTFYDPVPKREMPEIVAAMDVSMIPLVVRLSATMPSKVYEALASGVPPIVPKGCEAERLVDEFEVGACYEPGDADEFTRSILELADRGRWERCRDKCIKLAKRFDRNVIAAHTAKVLDAIAAGRPLPPADW